MDGLANSSGHAESSGSPGDVGDSGEFPTLYADDTMEPAPYQAALFHLQQGLAALQGLSPGRSGARKKVHRDLLALQQQVLSLLHIHFAPEESARGIPSFSERLRRSRDEAGLTQEDLARLSGLSASLTASWSRRARRLRATPCCACAPCPS